MVAVVISSSLLLFVFGVLVFRFMGASGGPHLIMNLIACTLVLVERFLIARLAVLISLPPPTETGWCYFLRVTMATRRARGVWFLMTKVMLASLFLF
jgi:hypothetical protein